MNYMNKEYTFLFDLICDDLEEEITKDIKWFKRIDKKSNIITYHRLNFIKEPELTYDISFFYCLCEKGHKFRENSRPERFSENRGRKYKVNKKGLIEYNFNYGKFKEIKN